MSANSTTQLMPVFYEYLIGAIFYIPSFVSQFGLLAQIRVHKLVNDLSANLLINIVCWAVGLFFGLCSGLYVLFNLESAYKSTYFMLISGGAFGASALSLSISILLMTVDRMIALLLPTSHKIHRRFFVIFTACCCSGPFFVSMLLIFISVPPLSPYTWCKTGT